MLPVEEIARRLGLDPEAWRGRVRVPREDLRNAPQRVRELTAQVDGLKEIVLILLIETNILGRADVRRLRRRLSGPPTTKRTGRSAPCRPAK